MSVETEIVIISITQDTIALQRAGFGVPLLLSYSADFPDARVRYYSGKDAVAADGFSTTSLEYRVATALFSQERKPALFAIGKADNKPTLRYAIGATALKANDARSYKISVAGEGFIDAITVYTTDATPSPEKIHNALVTALNAVTGKNYLATFAPLAATTFPFTSATQQLRRTAHGLKTGDGPLRATNTGGALPGGLALLTDYFVIRIDADTFLLATSLANALAGTSITLTSDGTGTQTLTSSTSALRPSDPFTVTATTPGKWFSLELANTAVLSSAQTHADPGIAADLDAIALEDSGWYCLLTAFNSQPCVLAAATWVEAQSRATIYVVDTPETAAINTAASAGTDTLATLHAAAFKRTAGTYHHRPATCLSACWAGDVLPIDPGGETWALKRLTGIGIASKLTDTHRKNLRDRKANFCVVGFGQNITFDGTTADGNFIDVTRGLDWVNDDMTKGIGGVLIAAAKIGMDDSGIAKITNQVAATLDRAVRRGIFRDDTIGFTVGTVDDIPQADRAIRKLPDVLFEGVLEGAIHRVEVKGRVSI